MVEATIKVHVGGERIISTAEGNGPVNALDTALRQAITQKYPHLSDIELVNYKVRILDETKGTGAKTRVLLDASDGEDAVGQHRREREHHRGELGGPGRLHRVRHGAQPAEVSRWTHGGELSSAGPRAAAHSPCAAVVQSAAGMVAGRPWTPAAESLRERLCVRPEAEPGMMRLPT